jgi:hypothetical protein
MIETSRYLINQLLGTDNRGNGLDDRMLGHLQQFLKHDFLEYNSRPYQEYHMFALQNLYDFACDPRFVPSGPRQQSCARVKLSARMVLDYVSAKFAVSSNGLRRYAPFRRRKEHLTSELFSLNSDPQTYRFMMLAGITQPAPLDKPFSYASLGQDLLGRDDMQAAAVTSYRVPDLVWDLLVDKPHNSFYQIFRPGEGREGIRALAAAERYWSTSEFLISAGGMWTPGPYSDQCHLVCGDEYAKYVDVGQQLPTTLMPTRAGTSAAGFIQVHSVMQKVNLDGTRGSISLDGRGDTHNVCVAPGFACGQLLEIPGNYLLPGCFTTSGPWIFIDASGVCTPRLSLGFYIAAYNGASSEEIQKAEHGDRQALMSLHYPGFFEALSSKSMDFGSFRNKVLTQNGSRRYSGDGTNEYATATGKNIQFRVSGNLLGPPGDSIISIDGQAVEDVLAAGDILNSCDRPPCERGHGSDGYIRIDNPFLGKRLVLDMRDAQNPQRYEVNLP